MKEDYIAAAQRIQDILDDLKSKMNQKTIPKDEAEFCEKVILRRLQQTRDLWKRWQSKNTLGLGGNQRKYRLGIGKPRNDDKKIHNCIIGWDEEKIVEDGNKEELSVKDKNKDIDAFQNFTKVLEAAGFEIVKEK